MSDTDQLIAGWILRSWSDTQHRKKEPTETEKHIWACGPSVKSADVSWDCGCYSEYTRDDTMILTAVIGCQHGTDITYDYGYLSDFPRIIRDVLEERADDLADVCTIESDEGRV